MARSTLTYNFQMNVYICSILLLLISFCHITSKKSKGNYSVSRVRHISNCSEENAYKIGDTLYLIDIKAIDTLEVEFSIEAGVGFGWDYIRPNIKTTNYRLFDSSVIDGKLIPDEYQKRYYKYRFIIKDSSSFELVFFLRRTYISKPEEMCIIAKQLKKI